MQRHFDTSEELCRYLADRSDTVILSFPLGKDAIGSWLHLREYFPRVIPYYLYLVPDLEFVNRSVRYFEDFFGTRIIQLPHPSLYRMLNNLTFQAPENCHIIEEMWLHGFDYTDIREWVLRDYDLPKSTFIASGVRRNDSLARRISIKRHGALNDKQMTFFPCFDWDKKRLVTRLYDAKVKLPVDYKLFGRSFDGIDYRFLKPIHDYFPADYRRILEFFPLAELEIKRREWRERYYGRKKAGV